MNSKKDFTKLPIFLYDSECTLCTRFKASLLRVTDKYTPISIHDEEIYIHYPQLDKAKCHKEFHLIDEDQKIYAGSDALEQILKEFPGVKKFAWLIESEMGKKAVDFFYQSANRYRDSLLNRCGTCKNKS